MGLVAFALTPACAAPASAGEGPRSAEQPRAEQPGETGHLVVTAEEALWADELVKRAEAAFENGRYAEALADYERLLRVDAEHCSGEPCRGERPWVSKAWFGAGSVHDMLGDREAALEHYQHVVQRFPRSVAARIAAVRCVRLLVHLERIEAAAILARKLLAEQRVEAGPEEMGPLEQVALLSAVALDLTARGDDVGAMRFIARARQVVEERGFDRLDTIPRDLAQLYFALAEVRRLRAERLDFEPMPNDFAAQLEQRCQLLLDAQSAYSDAMRAHDAHWSAMAGFRVGELYQKLHEDVMRVEVPSSADTAERRALFEGAMRLRYSILLTKARTMLEHTLGMIERTGQPTRWADMAREAHASLLQAIAREEDALARLPHSRAELQAALDHLQERAQGPAIGSGGPQQSP